MTSVHELLPTATRAEAWRELARLGRPHRRLAAVTLGSLVLATGVGLAGPALLGHIVDLATRHRPASAITPTVVALALVVVVQGALSFVGEAFVARLGETMLAGLRERVVGRALGLPLGQLERAGSGDLISRVTGDVSTIAEAIGYAIPELAASFLTVGLTFFGLLALDWRFALAAACAIPFQAHTLRWYLRRSAPIYAAERIAEGERTQQLYESIDGARTVRAFRLGARHRERIAARSLAAVDLSLAAVRIRTRLFGRLNAAELVGMTTILVTGFLLVRSGGVSVGAATAAALYFHRLFDPVNSLVSLADDAQAAAAAAARLVGVTLIPTSLEPAEPRSPADRSIRVRGVRHAYRGGLDVLHAIDLDLRPGEHVALIGSSGAGKTTLAKLIAGIHEPTSGEILIGALTHAELGLAGTRRTIALLTQETYVFSGTLADDLRLAKPAATAVELADALARVGVDWLTTLPDELETAVGAGGHRLDATQAEQVALARLLLADPPIAILDEATADAGSAGARILDQAARRVLEGRTALIVAHRLTQATGADRIAVLELGRIVEQGSHDELVDAGGTYADIWAAWEAPRR